MIRDLLNRYPQLASIAAGALLVLSLGAIVCQLVGGGGIDPPTEVWYMDLNTGELYPGPAQGIPPIDAPSGPLQAESGPLPAGSPAGVRAYVFSCGDQCSSADQRFVGWIQTYLPQVKTELEQLMQTAGQEGSEESMFRQEELMLYGSVVRAAKGEQWMRAESPEGNEVSGGLQTNCPSGQRLKVCLP